MNRWVGKVAVVTGASCGIGASISEKLVGAGVQVVGLARRNERIDELATKLTGQKGKLHAIKADVTKESDILEAFKWTIKNVGPVHILINNAGSMHQTDLINGDTEKWKKVIDVNVLGLCIATREAVKNMRENKIDGHIVHINSIGGHIVVNIPGLNVYPASKHAVTALTETLRQELNNIESKIKITSVSPGFVRTEINKTNNFVIDSERQEFFAKLPVLQSEDVANAVLYTLSTPPHVQVHEIIIKPLNEKIY